MELDKTNFWDDIKIDRPSLTNEMITFTENKFNVKLPELFIDLLKIKNGGQTIGLVFPLSERVSYFVDYIPLWELNGIITEESILEWQQTWDEQRIIDFYVNDEKIYFYENLLETPYMTEVWDLPEKQILLAGEGHWWITLDYRFSEIPNVRWICLEENEDIQIAVNFEEFINKLEIEEDFIDENED